MSITVHPEAVRKVANQRADGELKEKLAEFSGRKSSGVTPLGSRITTRQVEITAEVIVEAQIAQLRGNEELLTSLQIYAETGDASKLATEQNEVLKKVVKACRERAIEVATTPGSGESQARRFWPRKVAAIVCQYDAQPPAPSEPESTDVSTDETGTSDTPSSDESQQENSSEQGDEPSEEKPSERPGGRKRGK